jgi:hypothetical protein
VELLLRGLKPSWCGRWAEREPKVGPNVYSCKRAQKRRGFHVQPLLILDAQGQYEYKIQVTLIIAIILC